MADPGGADQMSSSFESLLDRLRQQSANSPNSMPSTSDQSTNQRHHQQNQAQNLQQPNELLRSFYHPSPATQASQSQSQSYGYQQKGFSPPTASPLSSNPHPLPGVTSPLGPFPQNRTPAPSAEHSERTLSLLSLLKLPQSTSGSLPTTPATQTKAWTPTVPNGAQNFQAQQNQNGHGRAISASDLVASFMGKQVISASKSPPTTSHAKDNAEIKREPKEPSLATGSNPQDFLLQLLNRPKPAQDDSLSVPEPPKNEVLPEQRYSDAPVANLTQTVAETSLQQSFPNQPQTDTPSPLAANGSQQIGSDGDSHPATSKAEQNTQKPPTAMFTYVNPFEQLAASSPRNRTPKLESPHSEAYVSAGEVAMGTDGCDGNKRKNKESPDPVKVHSRRKLSPNEEDISSVLSSPAVGLLPDGRSHLEALMGIGAPDKTDTAREPPVEVGMQQDKQAQEDPKEAQTDKAGKLENMEKEEVVATEELSKEMGQHPHDVAVEIKKEAEKDEDQDVLEEGIPSPVAGAVKNVASNAAEGNLADSWESADGEDTPEKDQKSIVRVYNFPMKPFVSITLKPIEISRATFRADSIMDISRLKKDFDQIDRTLTTSTSKFIVYALAKNGGFRVIRQADGRDKQVFRGIHDRIFNVSVSTARSASPVSGTEAVLGTGLSGTIYWTLICKPPEDCFDQDIESYGFILPPTVEAHASGGQLKTRAKTSSCHPEFFAVGRGKSIFIVWPLVARDDTYVKDSKKHRVVDSEKYFKERCLKINTGKAGKDFTFSEDDTTVVSLDKAGRVRVWDVQELVSETNGVVGDPKSKRIPIEVNAPLLTLMTAMPSEKAWPTSVLLVDKLRPYVKRTALRYLIVGMKQNHTLQLWDLGLGKAVQELNFPHDKESDAICSIAYDPASGIIVVGHPTRNSIYFIHLSAPKYNLNTMSQARYIQRVAQKDPSIPKPEATAIMSGLREYSFATKGQLRSLDILSRPHPPGLTDRDNPVLFELYCMHSKGVTCVSIKKEDLGWSKESRVLHPVNAVQEGVVEIEDLREHPTALSTEPSSSVNENDGAMVSPTALVTKPTPKEIVKKSVAGSIRPNSTVNPQTMVIASTLARVETKTDAARAALINGTSDGSTKPEKLKRVKKDENTPLVSKTTDSPSYAIAARRGKSPIPRVPASPSKEGGRSTVQKSMSTVPEVLGGATSEAEPSPALPDTGSINLGISGNFLDKEMKKVEKAVSAEFSKVIARELGALYNRFDDDRRVQQAAGEARQDAILRLVSSTLSENVEKTLGRIINSNIQQIVLPSIADVTATTIDRRLAENLAHSLSQNIPRELKTVLPEAIGRAIQSPDVLRVVADSVALKLAGHVENEFSTVLHNIISPAFKSLTVEAAKKIAGEVEHRTAEQLRRADLQRQNDSKKMDQLTNLIRGLSETVHTMASAQAEFQSEILKLQRQLQHQSVRDADTPTPPVEKSPEELEAEAISQMLDDGRTEEGTVMWLQSGPRQAELFDRIFARQGPGFVRSLSPLVMLSVAAAITTSFDSFPMERLQWLENILLAMDPLHQEVREMVPKIMDVLIQRMEHMYMGLSESNTGDPVLKKLPALWRKAKQLRQAAERSC